MNLEIGGDVVLKIFIQIVQDLISLSHAVPIRQSSEDITLNFLSSIKQRVQGTHSLYSFIKIIDPRSLHTWNLFIITWWLVQRFRGRCCTHLCFGKKNRLFCIFSCKYKEGSSRISPSKCKFRHRYEIQDGPRS